MADMENKKHGHTVLLLVVNSWQHHSLYKTVFYGVVRCRTVSYGAETVRRYREVSYDVV